MMMKVENTMINIYEVGGCVRDRIMGLRPKDIDLAVEAPSYESMRDYILKNGGTIYLEQPQFFTLRGKLNNINADFVLCRREHKYSDGRRPDKVDVGTIDDDLGRRDFTINAIAKAIGSDNYHDPHGGIKDIEAKIIRCVGNPVDRFTEDSLRLLRALRFAITKDFALHESVAQCLWNDKLIKLLKNVSVERIREELFKCFKHSTYDTLTFLKHYPFVADFVFNETKLWLKPSLEE